MLEFDVIVVGGGSAGMSAALAASSSARVALVSKDHPIRSGSNASAAGINAPLDPNDDPDIYVADTVRAGDFLSEKAIVQSFCDDATQAVIDVENIGLSFDRDKDARLDLRKLGGAAHARAAHGADWTGIMVVQSLWGELVKAGVRILDEWYATRLVVNDDEVNGVIAVNQRSGEIHAIGARAVILATGGAAGLYRLSTSPTTNTGDGLAIAFREGLPLRNMEFVQFNPTGLYFSQKTLASGIAISEAVRSEGGTIRNSSNDKFMNNYSPKFLDLAPRDVVSRAIESEITEGRGIDENHVSLDLTEISNSRSSSKLPSFQKLCHDFFDLDPGEGGLPIAPSAHSTIGGIATDGSGATVVRGLYAIGECANSGIHGAESLAANGTTEALIYGRRSGTAAADAATRHGIDYACLHKGREHEIARIGRLMAHPGSETVSVLKHELQAVMSKNAGVLRDGNDLQTGRNALNSIDEQLSSLRIHNKAKRFNQELRSALELINMVEIANVIVQSAQHRIESRGSHFRTDHPQRDDDSWRQHTLAHTSETGPMVTCHPLTNTIGDPEERSY